MKAERYHAIGEILADGPKRLFEIAERGAWFPDWSRNQIETARLLRIMIKHGDVVKLSRGVYARSDRTGVVA